MEQPDMNQHEPVNDDLAYAIQQLERLSRLPEPEPTTELIPISTEILVIQSAPSAPPSWKQRWVTGWINLRNTLNRYPLQSLGIIFGAYALTEWVCAYSGVLLLGGSLWYGSRKTY